MVIRIPCTVEEVTYSRTSNAPVRLLLSQDQAYAPDMHVSATFSAEMLAAAPALQSGVEPGKKVVLLLAARDIGMCDVEPRPEAVSLKKLCREESILGGRSYVTCLLEAETNTTGGRFSITPCPYFQVRVRLSEEQFEECRLLTAGTHFEVGFE